MSRKLFGIIAAIIIMALGICGCDAKLVEESNNEMNIGNISYTPPEGFKKHNAMTEEYKDAYEIDDGTIYIGPDDYESKYLCGPKDDSIKVVYYDNTEVTPELFVEDNSYLEMTESHEEIQNDIIDNCYLRAYESNERFSDAKGNPMPSVEVVTCCEIEGHTYYFGYSSTSDSVTVDEAKAMMKDVLNSIHVRE